ncbi:MAG: hypothetical protein ACLR4A_13205 [Christensenellales bacterium]
MSDTGVMLAACARDEQAILTRNSALEPMLACMAEAGLGGALRACAARGGSADAQRV